MAPHISLYGRDPVLLGIRELVLSRLGTISACQIANEDDLLEMPPARFAVLCSSLGSNLQETVAKAIGTHWPETTVLMIRGGVVGLQKTPGPIYLCGNAPKDIVQSCETLLGHAGPGDPFNASAPG